MLARMMKMSSISVGNGSRGDSDGEESTNVGGGPPKVHSLTQQPRPPKRKEKEDKRAAAAAAAAVRAAIAAGSRSAGLSKRELRKLREVQVQKQVKVAAGKASNNTSETSCKVCGKDFPSRSKLFQHIKESGHAALK